MDEGQVTPVPVEAEVGMEFTLGAVLIGSEDDRSFVGVEGKVWNAPLCRLLRVIGEIPSVEVDRVGG